jgi:hypothetical protein
VPISQISLVLLILFPSDSNGWPQPAFVFYADYVAERDSSRPVVASSLSIAVRIAAAVR